MPNIILCNWELFFKKCNSTFKTVSLVATGFCIFFDKSIYRVMNRSFCIAKPFLGSIICIFKQAKLSNKK